LLEALASRCVSLESPGLLQPKLLRKPLRQLRGNKMPNISSYGSANKKPVKKKTGMNKPNVRGGMSRSTMVSKPKKRK